MCDALLKFGAAGDRQFLAVSLAGDAERGGNPLDLGSTGHMQARAVVPDGRAGCAVDDRPPLGDMIGALVGAEPVARARRRLHRISGPVVSPLASAKGRQCLGVSGLSLGLQPFVPALAVVARVDPFALALIGRRDLVDRLLGRVGREIVGKPAGQPASPCQLDRASAESPCALYRLDRGGLLG